LLNYFKENSNSILICCISNNNFFGEFQDNQATNSQEPFFLKCQKMYIYVMILVKTAKNTYFQNQGHFLHCVEELDFHHLHKKRNKRNN